MEIILHGASFVKPNFYIIHFKEVPHILSNQFLGGITMEEHLELDIDDYIFGTDSQEESQR